MPRAELAHKNPTRPPVWTRPLAGGAGHEPPFLGRLFVIAGAGVAAKPRSTWKGAPPAAFSGCIVAFWGRLSSVGSGLAHPKERSAPESAWQGSDRQRPFGYGRSLTGLPGV